MINVRLFGVIIFSLVCGSVIAKSDKVISAKCKNDDSVKNIIQVDISFDSQFVRLSENGKVTQGYSICTTRTKKIKDCSIYNGGGDEYAISVDASSKSISLGMQNIVTAGISTFTCE